MGQRVESSGLSQVTPFVMKAVTLLTLMISATHQVVAQCSILSRPLDLSLDTNDAFISLSSDTLDGADCQWRIHTSVPNGVISIDFHYINIVRNSTIIRIYDGHSPAAKLLSTLSGHYVQPMSRITSSREFMYVSVSSNGPITSADNFRATVFPTRHDVVSDTYDTNTACSASRPFLINANREGSFASPNYPGIYYANAYCGWQIAAVPANQRVKLDFIVFETETHYDTVCLYDGLFADANKGQIMCLSGQPSGLPLKGFVTKNTPAYMSIEFRTDSYVEYQGFVANYTTTSLAFVPSRINSSYDGRLEVYYDLEWRYVCFSGFDNTDAGVACKAMGYASGKVYGSYDTYVSVKAWFSGLDCVGTETSLIQCKTDSLDSQCSRIVQLTCSSYTSSSSDSDDFWYLFWFAIVPAIIFVLAVGIGVYRQKCRKVTVSNSSTDVNNPDNAVIYFPPTLNDSSTSPPPIGFINPGMLPTPPDYSNKRDDGELPPSYEELHHPAVDQPPVNPDFNQPEMPTAPEF